MQPDQYAAYRYLALVYQQQQRPDEADAMLGEAIRCARQREPLVRAQLHGQRARLYRTQNKLDKALDDLDSALGASACAEDHAERGRILLARRQYEDALAAFAEATRLRPSEPEVYRWKAEALLSLRRDRDAALALGAYLEKGGRPTAEVYRTRGQIRSRLGQFSSALNDFSEALGLQRDPLTLAARGWIYLANDVLPLALTDFEDAIRLRPDHAEAHAGRGLIFVLQGQTSQALADAETALRLAGDEPTPRLLWNVTHIYSQLVKHLEGTPGVKKDETLALRYRCLTLGQKMLERTIERLPADERRDFWRRHIMPDELLQPLRGTPAYERLDREYGK